MRMRAVVLSLASLASLSLLACGGPLSEADAKKAWAATRNGLNASPESGGITALEEYTGSCSGGGTAEFKSTGDVAAGEITTVNFAYDVTYKDCQEDGIVTNGTITYTGDVVVDGTLGATSVKETYTGDLVYSGEVSGTCTSAMEGVVETSVTGVKIDYTGTFCDYEGDRFEDVHVEVAYD